MTWSSATADVDMPTADAACAAERAEAVGAAAPAPSREGAATVLPAGDVAPAADVDRAADAFIYTVSVRSLCEFTAKEGDLDRRYTPSATALEGMAGQAAVAARRGPGYVKELALEAVCLGLKVRGRADGHDPATHRLEEIKTLRGTADDVPAHRRHLHWAQLETYGALYCLTRGVAAVELALVYVDVATQGETVLRRRASAAELMAAFEARCRGFVDWARQEAGHRSARDAALAALPFPPGAFRPGQRELAEAVYRATVRGRCLVAQAPTGIGKTLGTLYPMLRAMPGQQLDKLGYLTCKGTGRTTALDALRRLREAAPGQALRVLALVARDQACEHPDRACHGASCPLARGFYDRLPAARAEAAALGWLAPAELRGVALRHEVCPYYLGQEMLRWTDVVVGDVHHAFDPHGQLFGLAQALDWRLALLVDEAHNLLERARAMYSTSLELGRIRAARQVAPAALRPAIDRLLRVAHELVAGLDQRAPPAGAEATPGYRAHDDVPEALLPALQALNAALGEHLDDPAAPPGPLLDFYFETLRFQRLAERHGAHSLFDVERLATTAPLPRASKRPAAAPPQPSLLPGGPDGDDDEADGPAPCGDARLSIRNIVPGAHLRPRFAACHGTTLFSATLGTPEFQRDMLGLPDDCAWLDVPSAFPAEHLVVRVAERLSTRYLHRQGSLDAVVDLMARQFAAHPGNYLGFFSSFAYLEQAAARLAERHPTLPHWRQSRAMDDAARAAFLARFTPHGRGIGFAVLGGAFAEGVDLPGTRLVGAFVATLGLPPVTPVQAQFRRRLDALFGAGHGYADLIPGLQKVVQAAGRVLRTPDDRGWLWLLDERYGRPEVAALLPAAWGLLPTPGSAAPRE